MNHFWQAADNFPKYPNTKNGKTDERSIFYEQQIYKLIHKDTKFFIGIPLSYDLNEPFLQSTLTLDRLGHDLSDLRKQNIEF